MGGILSIHRFCGSILVPILVAVAVAVTSVSTATAHVPPNDAYKWTCSGGGDGTTGNCYQHQAGADEEWRFDGGDSSWYPAIRHGAAQ